MQEAIGKASQKQVSRTTAKCFTHDGIQNVQYVVRRMYDGQIYCVTFDDGTQLKITPDHCIWDGSSFVSAKELVVGQSLPGAQSLPEMQSHLQPVLSQAESHQQLVQLFV